MISQRHLARVLEYYLLSRRPVLTTDELMDGDGAFYEHAPEEYGPEVLYPFMHEWYMFEYRPAEGPGKGCTLLERWIRDNPHGIGATTMRIYRTIADTHVYGWFAVCEVHADQGLVLESVADGTRYDVAWRPDSYDTEVRTDMTLILRVAQIEDHYQIVSPTIIAMPMKLVDGAVRDFRATQKRTPWTIFDTIHLQYRDATAADDEPDDRSQARVSHYFETAAWYKDHPKELDAATQALFDRIGLTQHVRVEQVRAWCVRGHHEAREIEDVAAMTRASMAPFALILGLLPEDTSAEDVAAVRDALDLLHVTTPLPHEGGRCLYDSTHEHADGDESFSSLVTNSIPLLEWTRHADQGIHYFKKDDIVRAKRAFDKTFVSLHGSVTTSPEIYRLFANAGVCYVFSGSTLVGKRLLEYAHALNPSYTYATEMLGIVSRPMELTSEDEALRTMLANIGRQKRRSQYGTTEELRDRMCEMVGLPVDERYLARALDACPAHRYYEWLISWGINFATDEPPDVERVVIAKGHP